MKTIKIYRDYKIVDWDQVLNRPDFEGDISGLTESVDSLEYEIGNMGTSSLEDALTLETDSRISGDDSLAYEIENMDFSSLEVALSGETDERINGDDSLSTEIDEMPMSINKLYTPDESDAFVFTDNAKNLHIQGNIIQSGSTYETDVETLNIANSYITLRSGSTIGLGPGEYTGIESKNYDGLNDGRLVFDNQGWARVGDVGDEQILTTRVENPTDGNYAVWDDTNKRLDFQPLDMSEYVEKELDDGTYVRKIGYSGSIIELQNKDVGASFNTKVSKLNMFSGGVGPERINLETYGSTNTDITSIKIRDNDIIAQKYTPTYTSRLEVVNSYSFLESERLTISPGKVQVVANSSSNNIFNNVFVGTTLTNQVVIGTDKTISIKGIEYTNDISGSYTDRSLVDKGYIDNRTDGLSFWSGTQAEYDSLGTYDADTIYFIV